ncbi:MAG: hypothetical protein K6F68_07755 [Clostridiales bacterium]|nr:hypothetical protein [Clostridiales bacterium]
MIVELKNGIRPHGAVILPPSKSEAIRAALLLALSGEDPARAVEGFPGQELSSDILCALSAVGSSRHYVGGSAALMRMLTPVLLLEGRAEIEGEARVIERGIAEFESCFSVNASYTDRGFVIEKKLDEERYAIDCSRSSQFLSGLLIALPLLPHDCEITVLNGLVSKPYADMTLDLVRLFGGRIDETEAGCVTHPSKYAAPDKIPVTGDRSYAAVFEAMNVLGGDVEIIGSSDDTLQPDKDLMKLADMAECDITDCPDLLPVLAACACGKRGDTVIRGTRRLRTKESDRESSVVKLIRDLGGSAEVLSDAVMIHGSGRLNGGECSSLGDHRLAFAAAVMSMISDKPVTVDGAECVNKSAPRFWNDLERIGYGLDWKQR